MTYPPQPGQQPDPYGQQGPYGQQPPTGGFPQQQPPTGGFQQPTGGFQQPTGGFQQPYGYPQGQYGGGWGPQGPKKPKTALWVSLSALAVALVAFLITGLVAPGFLLGDDDEKTASSDPAQTGQAIVNAVKAHDKTALNNLKCPDASSSVQSAIDDVNDVKDVELSGQPVQSSDTEYTATLLVTTTGSSSPKPYIAKLGKDGEKWCWKSLSRNSSTSTSKSSSSRKSTTSSRTSTYRYTPSYTYEPPTTTY